MKLTSLVFYRLALLFPYLAAVILFPLFDSGVGSNLVESNFSRGTPSLVQALRIALGVLLGILTIISLVYVLGFPYWVPPYTVLAIFLWVWSLKKNKSHIYKMFIWSPIYLAILMTAFYILVSQFNLFSSMNYLGDDILTSSLICIFPASIAFGYLFIGLIAWIYDFLRRRGIIVDEEESILNLEDMKS